VRNIYQAQEVIEKELKGYQVIHRLLDVFVGAAVRSKEKTRPLRLTNLHYNAFQTRLVLPQDDTYQLVA
jgi:dGTP triphosphohydrolase